VTREDFVAVGCRLFAVYLVFLTVRSAFAALNLLSQPSGAAWGGAYAAIVVVLLAVSAFLWFFPLTVARKLLPVMREPRSDTAIGSSTALSIGITLIGLWFLADAISGVAFWLSLLVASRQVDANIFEWSIEQKAKMASTGVELALSLFLVLGSNGVKRLISRFRYGAEGAL